MAKVTGIGGFFFKVADTSTTAEWFSKTLDLPTEAWGRVFTWRDEVNPEEKGYTVLGLHSATSDYFDPSTLPFMLNLRVDDLDGMLALMRERGVEITKVFDPDPNGRFAHIISPDGIKIELWQPNKVDPNAP
jgi:predicted enzyme related to lactoylglutathione lyase